MPAERHEHFTADGTLVGYTVVVREPEFLPSDYTSLQGLGQYEAGVGPCGYSHDHLMDPARHFYVPGFTDRCPACQAMRIAGRILDQADDDAVRELGDKRKPTSSLPSDGVTPYARLLDADEAAQLRQAQAGTPSTAGRGPARAAGAPKRLGARTGKG